jgi:hypothetical protein
MLVPSVASLSALLLEFTPVHTLSYWSVKLFSLRQSRVNLRSRYLLARLSLPTSSFLDQRGVRAWVDMSCNDERKY